MPSTPTVYQEKGMKLRIGFALLSAGLALPAIASAQTPPATQGVLTIYRETVKPGKDAAHTKSETAWSRAQEMAKSQSHFVAMTAMTGPNEVWFVSGYGSLAEMQKVNEANDANAAVTAANDKYGPAESEFLQDGRQINLIERPDLSYSTGRPIWEMRFLTAQRILVRPGHNAEFVEARTAIKAAHEKAKLPDGYAIYQVTSGMPGGTYYLFAARKSLSELDDNTKVHSDPAYQAALGADWTKRNAALVAAYETSTETDVFSMNPAMSSAPPDWIKADTYWKPKAPPAKKAP
jgi:hypothetical protein